MIQYSVFFPELCLVGAAILILLVDLFYKSPSKQAFLNFTAVLGVAAAMASIPCPGGSWLDGASFVAGASVQTFAGFLQVDQLAVFFKLVILLAALLTLVISFRYFEAQSARYRAEFLVILLIATAGASALTAAREIITLYISLETLTISSYLLAAYMKKDKGSNEAGMKYLLLGAFSSAILLLGFSYLYGLSGTTVIAEMGQRLFAQPLSPLAVLAVILVIGGLAFKISLAPFHMWTPDVYEGAPTPVTAFLSVASKVAGFAAFVRLFWEGLHTPALEPVWVGLFAILAAASIVLGNLQAIQQHNIKRMMAYSSIAQAGYIATGFLAGGRLGLTSILFYVMVYLFANLGVFLAVVLVSAKTGSEQIEDFAGLWKRSPLIGVTLLVCLLSLAGVPPFAGFAGKWYLFSAAISQGFTWLAMLGVIFSVVSLYYYLMVVKQALVADARDGSPIPIGLAEKAVLLACIVATVVLGFWPTPLMQAAQAAASSMF